MQLIICVKILTSVLKGDCMSRLLSDAYAQCVVLFMFKCLGTTDVIELLAKSGATHHFSLLRFMFSLYIVPVQINFTFYNFFVDKVAVEFWLYSVSRVTSLTYKQAC